MKSLTIVLIIVCVVTADENSKAKPEKRQSASYSSGVLPPAQGLQPTPAAVVPNTVPVSSYQPNYLPTCVVQPIYPSPSVPAYQPSVPYVLPSEPQYVPQYQPQYPQYQPQYPQYQPQQYPDAYQPQQYPAPYQPQPYPAGYQPSQYPAAYRAQQYPVAYQPPQQSQIATPYSYSYFVSAANNADKANDNNINNAPASAKK
ncbi:Hypothetical protein CINCED_3A000593 [Cinara cedri]|uniref:Uncharacterized protein n=1 Tax=Cinara cedri TaxID=506608 RepID=A0A5E4M8P4_9HEMI|nr:Hypothetical protein CINCED_3A000593 [Cinara cedri]